MGSGDVVALLHVVHDAGVGVELHQVGKHLLFSQLFQGKAITLQWSSQSFAFSVQYTLHISIIKK